MKQVLTCSRICQVLECHEDTHLALHTIFIRGFLIYHPELVEELYIDLVKMTQTLQNATKSRNPELSKHQLACYMEVLDNSNLADIKDKFPKDHESNYQFMFFLKYMKMLEILFKFIASSRSCNWIMHLSGLKDMLSVITTMDRIKNRQILPTYFADMLYLNNRDPAVWKFFPKETLVYKRTPYPLHQLVGIMQTNKKARN